MVYDTILADIKAAMLAKDEVKRDCLRSLVSDIKNQSVNAGAELTEEIVLKCVKKAVKQHCDSIEQFEGAGRADLVAREKAELEVLSAYLPKMLSEEETREVIDAILQTIEAVKKNFGLVMKQLPKEVDRKVASAILKLVLK